MGLHSSLFMDELTTGISCKWQSKKYEVIHFATLFACNKFLEAGNLRDKISLTNTQNKLKVKVGSMPAFAYLQIHRDSLHTFTKAD